MGTVRNANRVLNGLSHYLYNIRDGFHSSIYYLNKEGRDYVDCEKIRKKGGHVQHTVIRNEFWFYNGCPFDWKNEVKVSDGNVTIIVDAMYKKIQQHFLEVDHTKSMKENRMKIAKYMELYENGLIAESLGHFPAVVFLTTTELRRKQLQDACKSLPGAKVYTLGDIK